MRTPGQTTRIVAFVLTLLTVAAAHADPDRDKKRLTWNDVYGRERVTIRDPAPRDFVWLDDRTLLEQGESWEEVDAVSGQREPFYDAARLQRRLLAAGVAKEDAKEMADGHWTVHDAQQRVCALHVDDRLIRAGLDGREIHILTGIPDDAELLTLSPAGNACAFVSADNLWCADFESRQVRALTTDFREHVRSGKADWVYYEEVLRRKWKAFQFSPDGRFLLFQQFDDSIVADFTVIDHSKPTQVTEVTRYPLAGTPNPGVRLGVVAVNGGDITWVTSPYSDPGTLITGFGWYPDSQRVYWYAQNRTQTWLDFLQTDCKTNETNVLFRETTEAWVEAPAPPKFLRDSSLLLLSERSGWKHVDHIPADGGTRRAVTSGEWDVSGIRAVNEDAGWILITGTRDSTIADQLYRVSLTDDSVVRLSGEDGHHVVVAGPSGELMVDRWSDHVTRSTVVIRDSNGGVQRRLHDATPPKEWEEFQAGRVEFHDVALADGATADALFVLPADFDESVPHPVWLKLYGGPRYSRVRNAWKSRLSDHLLAAHGIVVIEFDPRTAGGHGAVGAWQAWHQLGVEETRDVEAVCNWLQQQPWADGRRIGMSGWSYGGYLTSYVMTHSKCITAGIAGAPVTDWANYDTIYTERYMGTPQNNGKGYRQSSVVEAANHLHGRLLLIHGLRDDNVHPANTFQLVRTLQQADQKFELMVYPRDRHSINDRHCNRLRYDFILRAMEIATGTP